MLNKGKCILCFPSCVYVLQNEYFSFVKSFKYYFVVGRLLLSRWVVFGRSVSKWSVVGCRCSVDLIKPESKLVVGGEFLFISFSFYLV